jgi:Cu(I)/Ag(I) efflux system membrane fusion protein|tara:strand:+ start:525 stop:2123 length:1599 start_codon:yes stop_codon:yes gene_type:complete
MRAKTIGLVLATAIIAGAGGYFTNQYMMMSMSQGGAQSSGDSEGKEIDYWVAPMDSSFRRDAPGKSPMGMALVPVYKGGGSSDGDQNAVRINPAVVNNIGVKTQIVGISAAEGGLKAVGTIQIDEEALSDIHPRMEGWVERLAVRSEGTPVKRGALLFEIYTPALVAAQSEYLQAMKIGRASFTKAAEDRLSSMGMTSGQISRLRESGETQRRLGVYAPQGGVIESLDVREGMFIKPSDRAMQIADLSEVWLIADIFENEANALEVGQPAQMTLPAFPGEVFSGEVDFIYPSADMSARTVQARMRFKNKEGRLKPNMFASVSIQTGSRLDMLAVPQSAVIRSSTGDRVILALGDGQFRPARVETGAEIGNMVQIISGINSGERIVTSGQFLLDSEASLEGGLLRLTAPSETMNDMSSDMDMEMSMDMKADEAGGMTNSEMSMPDTSMKKMQAKTYPATGKILSLDLEDKSLKLDHGPVPELGWPNMKMSFVLGDKIDAADLKPGDIVQFEFREDGKGYVVTTLEPMPEGGDK